MTTTPTAPRHLTLLEIQDFKGIRMARLHIDDGATQLLEGRNGNGKSSILDGLRLLLGGKAELPDDPIRRGATKGKLRAEFGDLVVRGSITGPDRVNLTVTEGGKKVPSPQAFLDRMTGRRWVDPIEYERLKPAEQAETLAALVGLDVSDLDAEHAQVYENRTVVNRMVRDLTGELAALPATTVADVEEDAQALVDQLDQATKSEARYAVAWAAQTTAEEAVTVATKRVAALEAQLAAARAEVTAATAKLTAATTKAAEAKAAVIDAAPLRERLQHVRAADESRAQARRRAEAQKRLDAKAAESEAMTKRLTEIEAERQARIAAVRMPVEGLSIVDGQVLYRGIPLAQASQAERLRVSIGVALVGHPEIRLLLVRDGSRLDDESLALVDQIAAEHGAQVLIERVANRPSGEEGTFWVEAGMAGDAGANEDAAEDET